MSTLRSLSTGLVLGLAFLAAVHVGARLGLSGELLLALIGLPLVALGSASLLGASMRWWFARLLRGGLGGFVAGLAGLAAVYHLRDGHDWFDWGDERGGDVFMMILAAFSAVPGFAAAAAPNPGHGFFLAAGFSAGVGGGLAWLGLVNPGLWILLGIGTCVGTLVSALGRRA